jgi:hypothetical protein
MVACPAWMGFPIPVERADNAAIESTGDTTKKREQSSPLSYTLKVMSFSTSEILSFSVCLTEASTV